MNRQSSPIREKKARRKARNRLVAVIDIGSNSVRLVVYKGIRRHPQMLFNEKVLCGLGRHVAATGRMDKRAVKLALSTLHRFRYLCDDMAVKRIEAVATAAVREAKNGPEFIRAVQDDCGFDVTVLTGRKEARLSALGVLSGIPGADGIMGDLGGGSLELVKLKRGEIEDRVSLSIGPLRLLDLAKTTATNPLKQIRAALDEVTWLKAGEGQSLYLVGGAWRAMMRVHMAQTGWPLLVQHHYALPRKKAAKFAGKLAKMEARDIRPADVIPNQRRDLIPLAATILGELIARARPSHVVTSAFGLREGLIFDHLKTDQRREDPLIAACKEIADRTGRFPEHADILMGWIEPLFADETKRQRTLRGAACLLSDVAWRGHPDFRDERAFDEGYYGRFVGINHSERAMLALALYVSYGGDPRDAKVEPALHLLKREQLRHANLIGRALRLGQRLTGGTAVPLQQTSLRMTPKQLILRVPREHTDLAGHIVIDRLRRLAKLLGRSARIEAV